MASEPPTPPQAEAPGPLQGRRILVALSGGIACYKVATLVSRLVQQGAAVRVAMTDGAMRFITPLTFQSLSGQPVITSIWDASGTDRLDSPHVAAARWAELAVLAPASADMMAKLATGICDDAVSLIFCALPRVTPVLLAPAMNADMWANPIVQRNVSTLRDVLGYQTVGPDTGWQACRTQGAGRMAEPEHILEAVRTIASQRS